MRYVLYRFIDGEVLLSNLDAIGGSDEIERNVIDGGAGQVELPFDKLPSNVRNTWKDVFAPIRRGIALIDDSQPLGSRANALFAGWISSVDRDLENNSLVINFSSMNEYLAMRVAETIWAQEYVEPELTDDAGEEIPPPSYKASSWPAMLSKLVYEAFLPGPAGSPQPPSTVFGAANDSGTAVELPKVIDGTSYYDLLEQVRNYDSAGVEWQFVPTYNGTHIGFNFITGTTAQPFINGEKTETIVLSAAQAEKVTAHSTSLEADGLWNKVLARYTPITAEDAEQEKQRVFAAWQSNSTEMPLISTYQSTESEYTTEAIGKYVTAAMHDGQHGGVSVSFTVAEHWSKAAWIERLGSIITFEGVPDTISAGGTTTVRCVGMSFNAQNSLISVDFMPLLTKYPATPKTIKRRKATNKIERVGWTEKNSPGKLINPATGEEYFSDWDKFKDQYPDWDSGGLGGGGDSGTPTSPTDPYAGADGPIVTKGDKAGSEGVIPGEDVKIANNVNFSDFKETKLRFDAWDGIVAMSPQTMCQTTTNRIYGLDHNSMAWGSAVGHAGTVVDFNTGINPTTGEKNTPFRDIYIKKSYLHPTEGLGPVETVSVIPGATVKSLMPEYEWNDAYTGQNYSVLAGYHLSTWWVNNRLYVGIAAMNYSEVQYGGEYGPLSEYRPYYYNGKISVLSTAVDVSTGMPTGKWTIEPWTFPHDVLPDTVHTTRYGSTMVFGWGVLCEQNKIKNLTYAQHTAAYKKNYVSFYGDDQGPRNGHPGGLLFWYMPIPRNAETGQMPNVSAKVWNGGYRDDSINSTNFTKDFSLENSPFEYFGGHAANGQVTDEKKYNVALKNPIVANGLLISTWGPTGRSPYFTEIQKPMPRNSQWLDAPAPSTEDWTGNLIGSYGTVIAPVGGRLYANPVGFGYSNDPNRGVVAKLTKTAPVVEIIGKASEDPYKNLLQFPTANGYPYGSGSHLRPVSTVDGTTGTGMHNISRIFSFNGRLYHVALGGSTDGRMTLTTRSMKANIS